jgi:hypothetical protein
VVKMNLKTEFKKYLENAPPILDFEASSLSDYSYPISAGLVARGHVYYWLIKPDQNWIDWDTQSQALHGLSRFFIEKNGIPSHQVFDELSQILANEKYVYSDNPDCETLWLSRLGKLDAEIKDVKTLLAPPYHEAFKPQLKNTFKQYELIQHRADHDALALAIALHKCIANSLDASLFY